MSETTSEPTTAERPEFPTRGALDAVLFGLYLEHRGPWRVEQDWTVEVRSERGLIAKCRKRGDAESLAAWRDEYAAYMAAIEAEVDAMDEANLI